MIRVKCLQVGQLSTNCYLAVDDKTSQAVIIDPGDDADYISQVLSGLGAIPKAILATHAHFDHVLAVTELKLAYQIPFLMTKKDEFLLARMQDSAGFFTHNKADPPPKVDVYLNDFSKIPITNHQSLITISTPGHTPGSISFYLRKEDILFSGDLVFAGGILGRTDFAYSSQIQLEKSLNIILKLPKKTKILSGHGRETSIDTISCIMNKFK